MLLDGGSILFRDYLVKTPQENIYVSEQQRKHLILMTRARPRAGKLFTAKFTQQLDCPDKAATGKLSFGKHRGQ